ncbi:DUF6143 family protein [Bacillus sp. KH172YL63]|uniref:DUF6143 family protein n=1 Tax=Bacillus sp. KH172YL63 TaxID=2709784 RepID=UPI0013E41C7B|nr:DUF6143 family protein [Bacillus sp. KH172YL63]BCB03534.1 hypothetical protein KH172YL63_16670 [Bacillus sp. KH172YL63]
MGKKPSVYVINPAFQSEKGRLFAGTSGVLKTSASKQAWAQLVNPEDSKVNLYVSFFALTNFSIKLVKADFVVNAIPPGTPIESSEVSVLKLGSDVQPVGRIYYHPSVSGAFTGGKIVGTRAMTPLTTIPGFRVDGRLIIEPGTNAMFFVYSESYAESQIEFEWFESDHL